jgi:hypothetical protein
MRPLRGSFVVGAIACVMAPAWAAAQPAPASPAAPASSFTPILRNVTRAEAWSFFEPQVPAGDPDYVFVANRLLVGFRQTGPWHELAGSVQYVQFGGLPDDAVGPGPLGTGANYFDHSRETAPGAVYVKTLNILLRDRGRGLALRAGRMAYASGGEAASGDPAIEALKRMRLDSRLVGEFEWSLFQRSFDGVRGDWTRPELQVTGAALWPTQGGFHDEPNPNLRDVRVLSGLVTFKPARPLRHTEIQVFGHHYADDRPVTGRPDNTGRPVSRADLSFLTLGSHAAGVYPAGDGHVDLLGWGAIQRGAWYESDQQAWALALEGGYRWTVARWSPWIRGGWNHSSGDADAADNEHGTFMPPVPTARKYSLSTAYTFMNLDDLFIQAVLRPRADLSVRVDLHHLRLAEPTDLWYAGSGATRRSGTIFGYAGRRSGGADDLGTILEGSVDYTINRRWSINAYLGRMRAGDVVRATFTDRPLTFGYVENVIVF